MHGHIHEEFIRTLIKRCTVIANFELSIESTIEQENEMCNQLQQLRTWYKEHHEVRPPKLAAYLPN